MTVLDASAEAGAIAGAHHGLAAIHHQHGLAGKYLDEFVLMRVPVALGRPGARFEPDLVDAELGQAGHIAKTAGMASAAGLIHRRGIAASRDFGDLADGERAHGCILVLAWPGEPAMFRL